MRILDVTKIGRSGAMLAAVALLGAGTNVSAADAQATADAYEWSAEMIGFDEAAGTVTVRARVEGYTRIEGLEHFAEGERLTLVWTGRNWAAGVRDIGDTLEIPDGALSLPIEFVEHDGDYVSFRVPVPASSVERIRALEPGDRITAYSPRGETASWDAAVISMRHYNDVD